MIQIYSPQNIKFDMNGDVVLFPEICDAYSKLNGEWYMDLEHPLDEEGRWKYIVEEAVISAPTFMGKSQLFKIDKVTKTDTAIIAKAYPIFFDSADELFLYSCHPTSKNGQEALDIMTEGSKYSGESNITPVSTAYFENRNFMECVNGDDTPTFIQRWGGEVLYDNYKIIINERVGGDYGAEIRYKKNQESISCDIDMSEVTTRIVPIAYNGRGITNKFVDSSNANKYSKLYIRKMLFENVKLAEDASEEEDESIIICADQTELDEVLIELCNAQFEAGADKPKVTIDVSMVDLTQTEEYKDFVELEKIGLGDTVRCYNKVLEITTEARCIVLTWDCIRNCSKNIVLGDYQYDYFKELQSSLEVLDKIIGPGNTIMAERIQGVLNAMNTQLRYQKTAAKKQDVRAILFEDLDPESELFGALCLGTQGMQISNKRTADNRDWEWTTAWTAHGGYANTLILGILADKTGENYWNLETGELVLKGFATFKSLEEDGETVINGSNIKTGTINADRIDLEELFARKITASDMTITGKSVFLSEGVESNEEIESAVKAVIENGKISLTGLNDRWVTHSGNASYYEGLTYGILLRTRLDESGIRVMIEDTIACQLNNEGLFGKKHTKLNWKGDASMANAEIESLKVNGYDVYGDKLISFKTTPYSGETGRTVSSNSSMSKCQKGTGHVSVVEQYKVELSSSGTVSAGGILRLGKVPDMYIPSSRVAACFYVNETGGRMYSGNINTDGTIEVRPSKDMGTGTYYIAVSADYLIKASNIQGASYDIIAQPESKEVDVGTSVTFRVETDLPGTDTNTQFVWQTSSNNGSTWSNVKVHTPMANYSEYTISSVTESQDGLMVRCTINRGDETVVSDVAILSLTKEEYSVTYNLTNCTSSNDATTVIEGESFETYIEFDEGYTTGSGSVMMGASNITNSALIGDRISISKVTGDITINYTASKIETGGGDDSGDGEDTGGDTGGDNTGGTETLRITKQPQSVTVPRDQGATFVIEAEGTGLTFQWQKKTATSINYSNDDNAVSDANSSTFTINPQTGFVKYNYNVRCIVTDSSGNSITSDVADMILQS